MSYLTPVFWTAGLTIAEWECTTYCLQCRRLSQVQHDIWCAQVIIIYHRWYINLSAWHAILSTLQKFLVLTIIIAILLSSTLIKFKSYSSWDIKEVNKYIWKGSEIILNEENLYYDKYSWYTIWSICLELKL